MVNGSFEGGYQIRREKLLDFSKLSTAKPSRFVSFDGKTPQIQRIIWLTHIPMDFGKLLALALPVAAKALGRFAL